MTKIEICENNMRVCFRVNEDKSVELVDFSGINNSQDLKAVDQGWCMVPRLHQVIALQLTGETTTDMHAIKHNAGSESTRFRYVRHEIVENEYGRLLILELLSDHQIYAKYKMQFYKNVQVVSVSTTIRNDSETDWGIDYVSSFYYGGLCKNGLKKYYDKTIFCVPQNSWSGEAQWKELSTVDVGLSHMPVRGYNLPDKANNRFHYGNLGSWSTGEHLPMGLVKDQETGEIYYFQIEHSGSWQVEYGTENDTNLYVALMGPNDESFWWKNLAPGESFSTVPVAFGAAVGDENVAIQELTKYRRIIRRPNEDNEKCFVVFNDYMNCLMGDPTEEKELQIIDLAAKLGCEYYCMDCGWYDDGPWWDRVGEWKESKRRFPHGMKTVTDYVKSKGMKMGLWLEIEVMGTACDLADKVPDNWFFCLHGKRRADNKRYLLDFRNPEVYKYTMDVVDRLIADYGVEYFKIDYNVTTGPGSDIDADSYGDALLEHNRALYAWIEEVYHKHPYLVIENCGSGGQRMDYGLLRYHSLQSTSDQTDYISNAFIAANVACAVTPEQAGMWVYPYEDDREHVIFNMVNGLLLRPYISGLVWNMSKENLSLLKEGITLYKDEIRQNQVNMMPVWPNGFNHVGDDTLCYGLTDGSKMYLAVFAPQATEVDINLSKCVNGEIFSTAKVIYPGEDDTNILLRDNHLNVQFKGKGCARLLEIK